MKNVINVIISYNLHNLITYTYKIKHNNNVARLTLLLFYFHSFYINMVILQLKVTE